VPTKEDWGRFTFERMFNLEQLLQIAPGMIAFWVMVLGFVLIIFYYLFYYLRVARYKPIAPPAQEMPPISVVICAKNEEHNLTKYLPLILEQDYPNFEVVVVNDCSWDNTGDILEEFAKRHKNVKVVTLKEDEYYQHGKKVALMLGIKGATNELMLLTDADCKPASNQWLKNIASRFNAGADIVLGYGPYIPEKGLLNRIIRFDAAMIGIQYLSFSLAGTTYMGVGRNLAYKKKLFYKVKGFASHYHIPSGDDDLFINEAAGGQKVSVVLEKEAFTYTNAKDTFKGWWRQKQRHLLTGKRYKFRHKFLLGLSVFAQWIFFAGFITALILQFQWMVVTGLFALRLLIQMLIFNSCFRKLDEKGLAALVPFMELYFLIFYPVITLARLLRRKTPWN
jgi:cellulose synthase/poly-beta-1,6-N-acetylglucosamine synthase-like glycosyltransferase